MLKDDPTVEITLTGEAGDPLGQRGVINTLITAVSAIEPPACIALYGPWGSGKTVLMRNAERQLKASQHVTAWFDPWLYERQEDVLTPLIRHVLKAVQTPAGAKTDTWKKNAKTLVTSIGRVVLKAGFRALLANTIGYVGDGTATEKSLGKDSFSDDDLDTWTDDTDPVEQIRDAFEKVVNLALGDAKDGRKLVVFLDDLDRCLPAKVVELIEAVKLLLCGAQGRVVFVFGLDRAVVGEAIRQQYPGSSSYTGESYLEKIFDLSLETPPVSTTRLKAYAEAILAPLRARHTLGNSDIDLPALTKPFGNGEAGLALLIRVLSEPYFANPRLIKRTINRLFLLSQSTDTCAWISRNRSHQMAEYYLRWLAGAERFRAFRMQFISEYGQNHDAWKQPDASTPLLKTYISPLTPAFTGEPGKLLCTFDTKLREIGL
jgi:hypothetical protein